MYLSHENGTQFYKATCIQSTQHITGAFLETNSATLSKIKNQINAAVET